MADKEPVSPQREVEEGMMSTLLEAEVDQPFPLIIVDGENVEFLQADLLTAQLTHAEEVVRRYSICEEIPRASELSPFIFLRSQAREEWRSRAPEHKDLSKYPQIKLYTEEELREIMGKEEPSPPLLITGPTTNEQPTTSTEPSTPQRSGRLPGISTGGVVNTSLRRSARLSEERKSSPSTEEISEDEAVPDRSRKEKSPAKSPREKKESQVRFRLKLLDEEEEATASVPMSSRTRSSSSFLQSTTESTYASGGNDVPASIPEIGGSSRVTRVIQTRSRTHQGVNIGQAMREINNTLQEVQRRIEERERVERQTAQVQHERRAREAAIIAGANEAAREAVATQTRPNVVRPNLIFAGRRIPLLPAESEEEGQIHEVSSDSSFERALDEMEGELNRNSVSNPDDAPKPEISEESVFQESAPVKDDDVAMDENEILEPMEEDTGESNEGLQEVAAESGVLDKEGDSDKEEKTDVGVAEQDEEMEEKVEEDDEDRFQKKRKCKGNEKAIPPQKKKRVSRPASRTMVIREPSQAVQESSSSESEKERKSDSG